ncbi:MAG: hypothetical protein BHW36_07240 [Firmicutes bacterium CAG:24053_14]|nr:MAG: hypothetical protein BHW36_07240 [Firmicutes bacterium CAG:24053_14]
MVFALAACGKDDGSSETGSDSVPGTTDLTQADAEQLAKEYVTSGDGAYKILDKVESDAPRTNKISVPRIGSVDIANDTVEKSGSTCYRVTVKGTTNAYDEYGQYLDSFVYEYELYIKTQVVGEPTVTNAIIGGTDEWVWVNPQ